MIDIIKALNENKKEAISILKGKKDCAITFGTWDDSAEEYSNADDGPWIRYSNADGLITTQLVVAARYNEQKQRIEIIVSECGAKTDDVWFPLDWADDISFWSVLERIKDFSEQRQQVTTDLGYLVIETIYGLDVYSDDSFVCELSGKTLSDFTFNGQVDSDRLEEEIRSVMDCEDFLMNDNR